MNKLTSNKAEQGRVSPGSEVSTTPSVAEDSKKAKLAVEPSLLGAAVVSSYANIFGANDLTAVMAQVLADTKAMTAGDLSRLESMLFAQAHALQAIFADLVVQAKKQKQLGPWEGFMRIGLKAQNQCRMTLETLANLKNPPVVYARQANIANGLQQVNNTIGPGAVRPFGVALAAKSETVQTELLEAPDEQGRMDARATRAAGGADQELATLGKIKRPAQRRR